MSRISTPRRFIRIAKNCVIGSMAAAPENGVRRQRLVILHYIAEVLFELRLVNFLQPPDDLDGALVIVLQRDVLERFHRRFGLA